MHRLIFAQRVLLGLALASALPVFAQPAAQPAAPPALLPQTFAGLRMVGPVAIQSGPAAGTVDSAHAALLREDGLLDTAQATYAGAGPGMTIRAWRFGDATGAYAAFTAYRQPAMHRVPIGVDGSGGEGRFLFWTGATVIDARLADTKLAEGQVLDQLRALAAVLPKPRGPAAVVPPVRGYLPDAGLESESVHYAIGPAGYAATGATLPESVIDFGREAEVVTARYRSRGGTGTLMLIDYPTPQMAANRLKALDALLKSGAPPLTVGDPSLVAERIGPLVAFTSGSLTEAEAHALIRSVHYQEVLTINHPEGYVSEVEKAAKLLLGIAYLTGILAVAAVLLALFLGSGRVLIRRMRGQPDSSMNDDDFISLKLG
jgi:hypothetical protein